MNNDTNEMVSSLRKELRLTRILTVISIVVTLILFAVVFWLQQTMRTTVEPLAEQVSALDMDTVNSIMADLEVVTGELAEADIDWEKLSETVNSLDVDAVNETIQGLDVEAFNEVLQGLDTEELSETLANLNAAIEALEQLGNNMTSVMQGWIFGGSQSQ